MWPFSRLRPPPNPSAAPDPRPDELLARLRRLEDEFSAWEARLTKLTRENSRLLRSLAEVERREGKKVDLEMELEDEEDLVTRTLRFGRGS